MGLPFETSLDQVVYGLFVDFGLKALCIVDVIVCEGLQRNPHSLDFQQSPQLQPLKFCKFMNPRLHARCTVNPGKDLQFPLQFPVMCSCMFTRYFLEYLTHLVRPQPCLRFSRGFVHADLAVVDDFSSELRPDPNGHSNTTVVVVHCGCIVVWSLNEGSLFKPSQKCSSAFEHTAIVLSNLQL